LWFQAIATGPERFDSAGDSFFRGGDDDRF
jgi:hypothetical protein